jgi:endonuclease YncB( thermonuclease family)
MLTWTTDNTAATIVRDDAGRPFAQILFGEGLALDIAALLLEKGLARVDADHLPDFCEHYVEIERVARENGVGIWAD